MGHVLRCTIARLTVASSLALVICALVASTAGAACMGPSITYEVGEVRRGATIAVVGRGFGTACYDTGLPPEGVGALGEPATGIEIVLSQGGVHEVLARGSADADYTFEVDITVPPAFEPGEAIVSSRYGGGLPFDATEQPLIVLDEPPIAAAGGVVEFGPNEAATTSTALAPTISQLDPEGTATSSTDSGGNSWGLPMLVGLVLVAALVAMFVFLRPVTKVTSDPPW